MAIKHTQLTSLKIAPLGGSSHPGPAPLFLLADAQTIAMGDAAVTLVTTVGNANQIKSNVLYVDAESSGAGENLLLPPEAEMDGIVLFITNTGGENVVVKNDGGSTIITIGASENGILFCDGTTWKGNTLSTTEFGYLDGITPGTLTASKAIVVDSDKAIDQILFDTGGGTAANSAVTLGGGTGGDPLVMSAANKNCIEFRVSSTATDAGSDSRCAYLRLYLDGATTGGGEAVRAFTTVNQAVGTARGAHVSMNFGASGAVSGLGTASTHTLHLPAGVPTGTMAPVQSEFWLDDATSAPPSVHGLFWGNVGGDATNKASVKNLFYLSGVQATAASSGVADMVTTGCADSASDVEIKVNINGTNYWLLATATQPSA